jgi:hypothetical protein
MRVRRGSPRGASFAGPGTEVVMIKFGANVTVFLLVFGMALLDAVASRDAMGALLWLALGLVFLRADTLQAKR